MRRTIVKWIISIGLTFLLRRLKQRQLLQIRYVASTWAAVCQELAKAGADSNVTVAEAEGVLKALEEAIDEMRLLL